MPSWGDAILVDWILLTVHHMVGKMLVAHGLWAGRVLYRTTNVVARDLWFCGIIQKDHSIQSVASYNSQSLLGTYFNRNLQGRSYSFVNKTSFNRCYYPCLWCLIKWRQTLVCLKVKHRHIHDLQRSAEWSLSLNVWVEICNPWSFLYFLLKVSAEMNRLRFANSTLLDTPWAVILLSLPLQGLCCTLSVF